VRTFGILLFTLILSGFSALRCEATVYQSNGSVADVQRIHDTLAHDGDTITLPTGTFSWTSRLNITKGITLQGATTIVGLSSRPTVTDATIIQDNTPRSGFSAGIIDVAIGSSQSFRLTGFTFAPGSSTVYAASNGAIRLFSRGSSPNTSMRIDHCHFASLYQGKDIFVSGWVCGVADHNVFDCRGITTSFHIWHNNYGGSSQINGNGSWADYPWYGTNKFFFIEDNRINGSATTATSGTIDAWSGARWVARHNYFNNSHPAGHGTEGAPHRGMRASEVYDNTINWTVANSGGLQRSGSSLWHDNSFTGVEAGSHTGLANYRQMFYQLGVWHCANGTNPWDINDTEGNGTYVEGHPPFLFLSGVDNGSVNSQGVVHDLTRNWIPNQWVGYSVTNTNPASPAYRFGSFIISNTSNTITYQYYPGDQGGPTLVFNAGDSYAIYRILVQLDQNGRGKGDQVVGANPINSTTGTPWWTHEALEPCYSWNNVHAPTYHSLGFGGGSGPTEMLNRDYYNLGRGFAADATPAAVSSTYTAALNGVNYVGTFVYPHPLVTAQPTPTPTPTPTPSTTSCSRLQQRLDRLERRQRRLQRHHRSNRRLNRRIHRLERQLQLQHCL
jgi:hypothetical protein